MASIDNLKLHDIAVRNAVLLESLKKYEISKRDKVFRQLRKELDTVMGKVQYEDLGLMTKKEVAKLLRELKAAHAGFYDVVGAGLIKTVEDFSGGKLVASKSLWANVRLDINSEEEVDDIVGDDDVDTYVRDAGSDGSVPLALLFSGSLLLERLLKEPIPALGVPLRDMVERYGKQSEERLAALVMQAWGSGWTWKQLHDALLGAPGVRQGHNGYVAQIQAQFSSVVDTSLGFANDFVDAAVTSSILSKRYRWVSVMDHRTSAICQERNGKIFVAGKGPLPPAHMRCRSTTVPVVDGVDDATDGINESMAEWHKRQPESIKKYGSMDKSGAYRATTPLTPDEFFTLTSNWKN